MRALRCVFPSLFVLALFMASDVQADERDHVLGLWASPMSVIQVMTDGDGLSATIVALLNPTYDETESRQKAGQQRRDDQNPDDELQQRTLLGLNILSDYRYDGQWRGRIYDPESGNTYQSKMKRNRKGELEIRGYIGAPMFGRTSVLVPASQCSDQIVSMLANATVESPCAGATQAGD